MNYNRMGIRIKLLRDENSLRQEDLARKISEFANRERYLSPLTIASWEQGKKAPTTDILIDLAVFFNVSLDYLTGMSDERTIGTTSVRSENEDDSTEKTIQDCKISISELPMYDNQPIYVVFKNKQYDNQWGILDYTNRQVILKKYKLNLSNLCDYYSYCLPDFLMKKVATRPLTYSDIMSAKTVWIELKSYDAALCGEYNGWFKHNENKTALINAKGLTLPYDGLNVSYIAYAR